MASVVLPSCNDDHSGSTAGASGSFETSGGTGELGDPSDTTGWPGAETGVTAGSGAGDRPTATGGGPAVSTNGESTEGVDSSESSTGEPESWETVLDGCDGPLVLNDVQDVLVRDCVISDVVDRNAITIRGSHHVRIESCDISGISGDSRKSGIEVVDSTDVEVVGCTISNITSDGQSAGLAVRGGASADVIFRDNLIFDVYGNGIVSGGCSSCENPNVHDAPVPGLKILRNTIHDVGKTPSPVTNSPVHGMYIKAADSVIEGNVVYNSYAGAGLTIRSTATVRGNVIWDVRDNGIVLTQMKPPGPSMQSTVEDNVVFFTSAAPDGPGWAAGINLHYNGSGPLRYDRFEMRNNQIGTCSAGVDADRSVVRTFPFENLVLEDNLLVDLRTTPKLLTYFVPPSVDYAAANELLTHLPPGTELCP